jgi:hypothetical protein
MTNLMKALSDFQNEVPVIHKGTQGYGYSYADLPAIFKVINPLLKEHGLGFTQLLDGTAIKTVIFHCESGEMFESSAEIPQEVVLKGMNAFQVAGSAITYYRRYALSAALGLITDVDNDAAGEQETDDREWLNDPKMINSLKKGVAQGEKDKVLAIMEGYKVSKKVREEILG